jgi:PTH1 family peptidyl-tRNA hydrolase
VLKRARQGIAADVAETNLSGSRAVAAILRTFMNESGQAVAPLCRYFGIDPEQVLVIHDDIDVPFGKLKVQWGGGHGGTTGVRSVTSALKTEDFWRLKIGVGRPPSRMDPADYVLSRFRPAEHEAIDVAVYRAADGAAKFITDGGESTRQFAGELND